MTHSFQDLIYDSRKILRDTAPGYQSGFEVVAVRCNSANSTGRRKLIPGMIYRLMDSEHVKSRDNNAFDEFMNSPTDAATHLLNYTPPSVRISAIVGKNGSGKSSLVEFMMRLINNFAAALIGELITSPASERLHYIRDVEGDLWFRSDKSLFQLNIDRQKASLTRLLNDDLNAKKGKVIISVGVSDADPDRDIKKGCGNKEIKDSLADFFYTIITNYSFYAYNTHDFSAEKDSDLKLKNLKEQFNIRARNLEESHWIHGLFHKNDGYRAPLVITPTRYEGNINVNRENNLANERLLSLLIGTRNLRVINDHLIADCLLLGKVKHSGYGYEYFKKSLDMEGLEESDYEILHSLIIDAWNRRLPRSIDSFQDKKYYKEAVDYLVYKTVKIALTYPSHEVDFDFENLTEYWYAADAVDDIVGMQARDMSHITRKVFRTLAYLLYDVYPYFMEEEKANLEIPFESIRSQWERIFAEDDFRKIELEKQALRLAIANEVILPPPFLYSDIQLHENTNEREVISFNSLSSGERQIAYAVSSILYHLENIESVHKALKDPNRVAYRNVLLVMEEVELYFHPELQQKLNYLILRSIRDRRFTFIRGIHLLFVTHSPYILSDIPNQDVLALNEDGNPSEEKILSFGANIHDMLRHSFFLSNGARGAFAQWWIARVLQVLEIHKNIRNRFGNFSPDARIVMEENKDWMIDFHGMTYQQFEGLYPESLLRKWIDMLDEPLIRNVLSRECDEAFQKSEEEIIIEQIRQLEAKLNNRRGNSRNK